jgi:hypothetical protein
MMEEMKKESVICILLIVIVASCSSLRDINSQPFQNTPAPTATLTRAATSTSTITLEPLATSDFSQTPLPTLSSENSSRTVQVLMETNGGCRLPCWWGILPGKTSWQSAEKYLSSITTSIYESAGATPDTRRIEMLFPAPYPFDSEFRQVYRVKHDFVDRIEILPQDFSKYSLPEGMLNELDTPDMIFLGGTIEEPQSFQLVLYYPSRGVFALYSNTMQPVQPQDLIDVCFNESAMDYVDIYLWNPTDSFSETLDFIFSNYYRAFHDIELVTDMTKSELRDLFLSPIHNGCFQTASSFWRQ